MKFTFANTCIYDFITHSRLTDGGCNHSRNKTEEQCGGVKGSFPGYMFRFREGQPASIDNFKQLCKLLDSAGVSTQDPAYGVKTACLPSSVVTALKAACAAHTVSTLEKNALRAQREMGRSLLTSAKPRVPKRCHQCCSRWPMHGTPQLCCSSPRRST